MEYYSFPHSILWLWGAPRRVYFFPLSYSIPLYRIYQELLIHSTVAGHLGIFQLVAIMNKATINILIHVFGWIYTFMLVDLYPKVELLGCRACTLILSCSRDCQHFPKRLYSLISPLAMCESSSFSTLSTTFDNVSSFNFCQSCIFGDSGESELPDFKAQTQRLVTTPCRSNPAPCLFL